MTNTGKWTKFWELIRWLLLYVGTYLLGPFSASLIYWGLAILFPGLNATEKHQFVYFLLAMLMQTVLSFILVYVLVLRPKKKTWSDIGFTIPKKRQLFLYGLFGGFLIFMGIILFSGVLSYFQPELEPQYFETLVTQENTPLQLVFLFLCGSFLAPLTEEMLFRGLLYRGLRQYFRMFSAILCAGLIFGAVHFDLWRTLPLALGGMALCWVYEKTGSLWVTITAHGLWNAIMTSMVL